MIQASSSSSRRAPVLRGAVPDGRGTAAATSAPRSLRPLRRTAFAFRSAEACCCEPTDGSLPMPYQRSLALSAPRVNLARAAIPLAAAGALPKIHAAAPAVGGGPDVAPGSGGSFAARADQLP